MSCLFKYFNNTKTEGESIYFAMDYGKLCALLARELFVTKESFYLSEFILAFKNMSETYIPPSLTENVSETDRNTVLFNSIKRFSIIVDENPFNATNIMDSLTAVR